MIAEHVPGAALFQGGDDLLASLDRASQRLFRKEGHARLDELGQQCAVARKRLRRDEGLDLLPGQQLLVAAVHLGNAIARCDPLPQLLLYLGDGHYLTVRYDGIVLEMGALPHAPNADETNTYLVHRAS